MGKNHNLVGRPCFCGLHVLASRPLDRLQLLLAPIDLLEIGAELTATITPAVVVPGRLLIRGAIRLVRIRGLPAELTAPGIGIAARWAAAILLTVSAVIRGVSTAPSHR